MEAKSYDILSDIFELLRGKHGPLFGYVRETPDPGDQHDYEPDKAEKLIMMIPRRRPHLDTDFIAVEYGAEDNLGNGKIRLTFYLSYYLQAIEAPSADNDYGNDIGKGLIDTLNLALTFIINAGKGAKTNWKYESSTISHGAEGGPLMAARVSVTYPGRR